jgi:chromosome segregation ATPase
LIDDELDIFSNDDLHKLKSQLKKGGKMEDGEIKHSITELNEKLGTLIDIFDAAVEDLKQEDNESELISEKIDPIIQRLEEIDAQNKKLAQGMVAINSLVDEKLSEITKIAQVLLNSQADLKHTVQESKGRDEPSFMPSRMPPSSRSMDDLPPLPGGDFKEKKKFKLF